MLDGEAAHDWQGSDNSPAGQARQGPQSWQRPPTARHPNGVTAHAYNIRLRRRAPPTKRILHSDTLILNPSTHSTVQTQCHQTLHRVQSAIPTYHFCRCAKRLLDDRPLPPLRIFYKSPAHYSQSFTQSHQTPPHFAQNGFDTVHPPLHMQQLPGSFPLERAAARSHADRLAVCIHYWRLLVPIY
jgi:hypothetical protein